MTTLEAIRPEGNRGKTLSSYPYKMSDDLYLMDGVISKRAEFGTMFLRMRVKANMVGGNTVGPFRIPNIVNRQIIAAYAHPFHWGHEELTRDPIASDAMIVRPAFAIREGDVLECMLAPVTDVGTGPGALGVGTSVAPTIDFIDMKGIAGDFVGPEGAPVGGEMRPCTIEHVENDGASEALPLTHTDYQLQLSSGGRIRATVANTDTQPTVGSIWPASQESTRLDYLVNSEQQDQHRAYPKRNLWPVEDQTPKGDHDTPVGANTNPMAIVSVETDYDLPFNPTTLIKKVQLNSGQRVTRAVGTSTIIGREIGQGTGTNFDPTSQDPTEWCEFVVILTLGAYDADTLSGRVEDPYPFWV